MHPTDATGSADEKSARTAIKLDFFFQLPEVWPAWETLFEACRNDPRFAVRLFLLPFQHDSHSSSDRAATFLASRGIAFLDFAAFDPVADPPDLVFLQNPYDSTRPPGAHVDALIRNGIRVAYVPYGLEVGGGSDNLRWQYDLDLQRKAWRIFVRSETQKWMYGRHCQSGNDHVVVTGHPKLDRLTRPPNPEDVENLRHAAKGRKIILWTPHFTVGGDGWSTFEKYVDHLIDSFERQEELALLIRPHPLFFGRMRERGLTDAASEVALRKRLSNPPWVIFDESADYLPAFFASAALMADAGSFLLEYAATGKPILYLPNNAGPGLSESSAFVESYYQAESPLGIDQYLQMIATGNDPKKEDRMTAIGDEIRWMDGMAGIRIKDYVASSFAC